MNDHLKIRKLLQVGVIIAVLSGIDVFGPGQNTFAASQRKVASRAVDIWSDGTRLSGRLFYPEGTQGTPEGSKLPAIVLCHGWGGVSSQLNTDYAPLFAKEGFVVLTFDYRGWGESDSRLVFKGRMPKPGPDGSVTVTAQAIRELVDPYDQTEDIINVITFMMGEPTVDTARIGLWGTSYGGGHVVYVAAHDERVKCVVSQVASMDSRSMGRLKGGLENVRAEAVKRARGEIAPVPQGVDKVPGLRGTPFVGRMVNYAPVLFAERLNIPVLIIDAEKEELMDPKKNGHLVYSLLKDKARAKYVLIPGITHFEIYTTERRRAINMAIEWFDRHLKK